MKSMSIVVLKEQFANTDAPFLYVTLKNVLVDTLKINGKLSFEIKDSNKPDECVIFISTPENTKEIADVFFAKHVIKDTISFSLTVVKGITIEQ